MPKLFEKCLCGNNFFIEHENASILSNNNVYNILESASPAGYKIFECVFCRKQYVGRQLKRGQIDEMIPIENFSADDAQKFKERIDKFGSEKYSVDVLQNMIRKR
jgi:hypothetical protein